MSSNELTETNPSSSLQIWKSLSKIRVLRELTKEKGYLTYQDIRQHLKHEGLELNNAPHYDLNEVNNMNSAHNTTHNSNNAVDLNRLADILNAAGIKVYPASPEGVESSTVELSAAELSEKIKSPKPTELLTKSNAENCRSPKTDNSRDMRINSFKMQEVLPPALREKKAHIILQREKIAALEQEIGVTHSQIKKLKNDVLEVETALSSAKKEMIDVNMRLIFSIALKYSNRGIPFFNLINEGKIGLIRAMDEFEYKSGGDFLSYASWWIHNAIIDALIEQDKTKAAFGSSDNNVNCRANDMAAKEQVKENVKEQASPRSFDHAGKFQHFPEIATSTFDLGDDLNQGEFFASA